MNEPRRIEVLVSADGESGEPFLHTQPLPKPTPQQGDREHYTPELIERESTDEYLVSQCRALARQHRERGEMYAEDSVQGSLHRTTATALELAAKRIEREEGGGRGE